MIIELRGNKVNVDKFKPTTKKEFITFMQKILPYRTMSKEKRREALNDDWQAFKELVKE